MTGIIHGIGIIRAIITAGDGTASGGHPTAGAGDGDLTTPTAGTRITTDPICMATAMYVQAGAAQRVPI